jgi:chondroitin AC lyase
VPVFTSINQPRLKGDVSYITTNAKENLLKENAEMSASNIAAVYHNKIGYFLLQPSQLYISNKMQQGNWKLIADFYKDIPDSGKLFNLYIEHGKKPQDASYAYCVLPDVAKKQLVDFAKHPSITVLSNTSSCQAVTDKQETVCQAVFYAPNNISFGGMKVSSLNAGLVMTEKQLNGKWKITVADPTQKLNEYLLTLSGKFSGVGASYDAGKNQTGIIVPLPTDGLKGSSSSVLLVRE